MSHVLIGVFRNLEDAVEAREALREKGFADTAVQLHETAAALGGSPTQKHGFTEKLKSLFSLDQDYVGMYSEAVNRGHHLLEVHAASPQEVQTAAQVMEDCRCLDIDDQAREEGWEGVGAMPARSERVTVLRRVRVVRLA